MYVGYDREFPGEDMVANCITETDRHYQKFKKNYSYKFEFDKDTIILLKN
jgi:hypothetical protein